MKRPFHILHLRKSEGFYGAERVILELAQFFQTGPFRSWIGILNDVREPCLALFERAKEKEIPAKIFLCRSRLDLSCIMEIAKATKTMQIDLIHTHGFKADVYGWITARMTSIPIISTQHGWTHKNRLIRVWENISLYFLKSMNKVIGVSPQIVEELHRDGISLSKLVWVPNGVVVPTRFHSSSIVFKKEFGLNSNTWTIGMIGRLSIEKGHGILFEAIKKVHSQCPNIQVFIIGEGPLKEKLKYQVHEMGLDSIVQFLGFRSDIDRLYPMLDIIVSSSIREGFPLTILEAMAYGKSVVATKVGGVGELIQHGKTGLLVEPEDVRALANAIQFLIRHPSKAQAMGSHARRFVQENYSVERMCNGYQRIYEEFISR